jgi:Flp pilus assembly protein TadD
MTLNMTVATRRCIYQSADYRLLDWTTNQLSDFETQKIVLVNKFGWAATICFAGVGRTGRVDVGTWLVERVAAIRFEDPLERLFDELRTADAWLADVPPPRNRHSFSVGAFVAGRPVFALVSNFEEVNGPSLSTARRHLSASVLRPVIPSTFVSGDVTAVNRSERTRLKRLAARDPEPQRMYEAMASLNRAASERSRLISPACFTTYVRLTGEGGGMVHGVGDRPFIPQFAIPPEFRAAFTRLLDEQFGPGGAQIRSISSGRTEATEEFHQLQIRERPFDANSHSNYGAFLNDKKEDSVGAERAYARALELDPEHVNALGNLANLRWDRGDTADAEALYRKALRRKPCNENVAFNFARFLYGVKNDWFEASAILRAAIADHPNSGRLHLLLGELGLIHGEASAALESIRLAREKRGDQAKVEAAFACGLHIVGAEVGECLAAYQVAVALNPQNGALKLNLSQLLFLQRDKQEALKQLQDAIRSGLDEGAMLEAAFYQLAHTAADPTPIVREVAERLARGTRLRWNVLPNIECVRNEEPQKAALLETVRRVMLGEEGPAALEHIASKWPVPRHKSQR